MEKRKATASRLRSDYDRDCICIALRDYFSNHDCVTVRDDGSIVIDSRLVTVEIAGRTVRQGQVVIRPQPRPWAAEVV